MRLLVEAGLPEGVINMVQGSPTVIADVVAARRELAGLHFTGSTDVFRSLWTAVGAHIAGYRNFPRLVGETGGKDFVFLHRSADLDAAAVALVRGAFEYQGQKCSAASRAYVPASLFPPLKKRIVALMAEIRVGDVPAFRNFMGAVINDRAFEKITGYIALAKGDAACTIVAGGGASDTTGCVGDPTFTETRDPNPRLHRVRL